MRKQGSTHPSQTIDRAGFRSNMIHDKTKIIEQKGTALGCYWTGQASNHTCLSSPSPPISDAEGFRPPSSPPEGTYNPAFPANSIFIAKYATPR